MKLFKNAQGAYDALFGEPYKLENGRTLKELVRGIVDSATAKMEGLQSALRQLAADMEIKYNRLITAQDEATLSEYERLADCERRRKAASEKERDLEAQRDNVEREGRKLSKAENGFYMGLYLVAIVAGIVLFAKTFQLVLPLPEWVGWIAAIPTVVGFSILYRMFYEVISSPKARVWMFLGVLIVGLVAGLATHLIFSAGRELASEELRQQEQSLSSPDFFVNESSMHGKGWSGLGFWTYLTIGLLELMFASALAVKIQRSIDYEDHLKEVNDKLSAARGELGKVDEETDELALIIARKQKIADLCKFRKLELEEQLKSAYEASWNLREEEGRRHKRLMDDVWGGNNQ
jgi:hypothetical protein